MLIFYSLVVLFLLIFASNGKKIAHNSLVVCLLILYCYQAIRWQYGNDFTNYHEFFVSTNGYLEWNVFQHSETYEYGWLLLNKIFEDFGFSAIISSVSAINLFLLFLVVKNKCDSSEYLAALMIYMLSPAIMLIGLSAMRQSIAISIFLFSIQYIILRNMVAYSLLIVIASIFHTSAIILIPLYFVVPLIRRNVYNVLVFILYFIPIMFLTQVIQLLNAAVAFISDKYLFYSEGSEFSTGLGFLAVSSYFLYLLYIIHKQRVDDVYVKVYLLYFVLLPYSLAINMVGRIGMYMLAASVVALPRITNSVFKKRDRLIFVFATALFLIVLNLHFFYDKNWSEYYSNYSTIFN